MKKILSLFLLLSITGCATKKNEVKPNYKKHHKNQPSKQEVQDPTSPSYIPIKRKRLKNARIDIPHLNNSYDAKKLSSTIFGQNGANLGLQDILKIESLLKEIKHLTLKEQHLIAAYTAGKLKKEINSLPQSKQHLTEFVIDYLYQFSHHQKNAARFSKKAQDIGQQIIDLLNIEYSHIFTKPKETYLFLASQNARQLPSLINFWGSAQGQEIIRESHLTSEAETQGIIMDMGIMVGTQMGATLANDEVNTEETNLLNSMTTASNSLQASVKGFQSRAQAAQQKELQAAMTAFSSAEKSAQTDTLNAQQTSQAEQLYLYKNMSIQKPQQNYLFGQVEFDQLFALGTMLTPQGAVWKNPFAVGDWEYDATTNSFWQNQLASLYKSTKSDSGEETKSSAQAANNSIFTEYFTNKAQYTITGEISIYQVSYPFVAGIMFNKARWISGNTENLRKCRLLAISGTSASDIGVYLTEQFTLTDEQIKATNSKTPMQTPVQQIIAGTAKKKQSLSKNVFQNISFEPVSLKFSIQTSPTSVSFKVWNATQKEPQTAITVSQLDLHLYIYHGIGFVSPGAVAEFKITAPEDLIFSSKSIETYQKEAGA